MDNRPVPVAIEAARKFLTWVSAELRNEPIFAHLFDSRALDQLHELPQTNRLLGQLKEVLEQANRYEKLIQTGGGTAFLGNISMNQGDLVARDKTVNIFFIGGYAKLSNLYEPPEAVFSRVKVDHFIGRRAIKRQLDAFLNETIHKSGVFLIEGEAGIGKTALLAHLVNTRGYVHVFGDQFEGEGRRADAMRSLAAQLVSRYQLKGYENGIAIELTQSVSFLERILRQAASSLSTGEQIVIICDALDQAGLPPEGINPFGLPKYLPRGVYLIATQRPMTARLDCPDQPRVVVPLEAHSHENLGDIREYLHMATRSQAIQHQLKRQNYSTSQFVSALSDKSAGNWMYLHYVLAEIEDGKRAPLNLDELPIGLTEYYCRYWRDWREGTRGRGEGWQKWDTLYAPLLGMLAAAQKALSVSELIEWAGLSANSYEVEHRLLRKEWRAFVDRQLQDGIARYRFYHASLLRLMRGVIDEAPRDEHDQEFLDELKQRTHIAHEHIVDRFRIQCSGDWVKLINDDYARNNLALHLHETAPDELFELVAMSDRWAKARNSHEATYARYLSDLQLAWDDKARFKWQTISDQLRCMLIKMRVHSLANDISPQLLGLLVETNLWSSARALDHIHQLADGGQKAESLISIFLHLPETLKIQGVELAQNILDTSAQVKALSELVKHLSEPHKTTVLELALESARAISLDSARARALSDLAKHLSELQRLQALEITRAIGSDAARAQALQGLVEHLSEPQRLQALEIARAISSDYDRAQALGALAKYLSEPHKTTVLELALESAQAISSDDNRSRALSDLAEHLSEPQRLQALEIARAISSDYDRTLALGTLVEHLSEPHKTTVIGLALESARAISSDADRALALSALAKYLTEPQRAYTLEIARTISSNSDRVWILSGLAEHLSEPQRLQALQIARAISSDADRVWALGILAKHLTEPQRAYALKIARAISSDSARAGALSVIAKYLSEPHKTTVIGLALESARAIPLDAERAMVLSGLAKELSEPHKTSVTKLALESARAISSDYDRAQALGALAKYLTEPQRAYALKIARAISLDSARARALSNLAMHLSELQRLQAVEIARAIGSDAARALALQGLVEHLSEPQRLQALEIARAISSDYERALALGAVAKYLPEPHKTTVLELALESTRAIPSDADRFWVLSDLAEDLSKSQRLQALEIARAISSDSARTLVLSALAKHSSEPYKTTVLELALESAQAISSDDNRSRALSDLAEHLSEPQRLQALEIARAISSDYDRTLALGALAEHLSEPHKTSAFKLALESAHTIPLGSARASSLGALAEHLSEPHKTTVTKLAFETVSAISSDSDCARLLRGLAKQLSEPQRTHALKIICAMSSDADRASALSALAKYLSEPQQLQALEISRAISSNTDQALALSALAPKLTNAELVLCYLSLITNGKSLHELISVWKARGFGGSSWHVMNEVLIIISNYSYSQCFESFTESIPLLMHFCGVSWLDQILTAMNDIANWWP